MLGGRIGDGPVEASQQAFALASSHFTFRTVLALFLAGPFLAVLFLAVLALAVLGLAALALATLVLTVLFFRAGRLGALGLADGDFAAAFFLEGADSVPNVSSA